MHYAATHPPLPLICVMAAVAWADAAGRADERTRATLPDSVGPVIRPLLEGITILADDVQALAAFYADALGLVPVVEEEFYVAFGGEGIRLAIFSRPGMGAHTHD